MKRREFIALLSSAAAWPRAAYAQYQTMQPPPPLPQPPPGQTQPAAATADNSIGQVASLTGVATVTRVNATPAPLHVSDPIFKNDTLDTGVNSTLGITFDDETTFSLSADTRIVVSNFVYQEGGSGNAASFNVATGTAAFVASLVAKTGDMTISTPDATLGIRGTTGVVDVPAQGAAAAAPTIKLYPDADGHVGRIEVFDRQGARLGALTQGASAFAIRLGAGGRFAAVPYQIPPQEAARDRGVLQRLNAAHNIGRRMTIERRQLRLRNRQNNGRGGNRFNPFNRNQRGPGQPGQFRERNGGSNKERR
jgi:hypothetical protein